MGELDPSNGLPILPKCPRCQADLPDVVRPDSCPNCGSSLSEGEEQAAANVD